MAFLGVIHTWANWVLWVTGVSCQSEGSWGPDETSFLVCLKYSWLTLWVVKVDQHRQCGWYLISEELKVLAGGNGPSTSCLPAWAGIYQTWTMFWEVLLFVGLLRPQTQSCEPVSYSSFLSFSTPPSLPPSLRPSLPLPPSLSAYLSPSLFSYLHLSCTIFWNPGYS